MILLDTSGVLSTLTPDQRHHEACAAAFLAAEPPFVMSPFVLAELDYLITEYAGVQAEIDFLSDVAAGAYVIAPYGGSGVARAVRVIEHYRDLNIGLADASIVVLSDEYETSDVLTLDERYFRSMRTANGQPFRLLPADA